MTNGLVPCPSQGRSIGLALKYIDRDTLHVQEAQKILLTTDCITFSVPTELAQLQKQIDPVYYLHTSGSLQCSYQCKPY
jgi:hypothetical protein